MSAARFDAKQIDAIFASIDQSHLPGAAVGIAIGGRPVYRKGFGLANIELPIILSPTTRLRIASMSKHFTCLAYLLLCEEGKASVDDPIGKHLPELHCVSRAVTATQLMAHTSGLRDAIDIGWQFGGTGRPVTSAELLELYCRIDDVNAAPDACWLYNNGGYLLLSVAIERITGQSLEEVFRERIFEPAGLHDTMLRRWDTDFVPNSAALHMTDAAGPYVRSYLGMELTGDAGVVSTVDDMLRWLAHMDAPRVGSGATWRAMKTLRLLANGTSTGYGLGLVTDHYRGVEILYHDGGVKGGNSRMLKVPAAGLDVVVLVNRQDVSSAQLAEQILEACLPGLSPVSTRTDTVLATGTFQSQATARVVQLFERDAKPAALIDGFEVPLVCEHDGVLRPISHYRMLKLEITTAGDARKPSTIWLNDFGRLDELRRLDPVAKPKNEAVDGVYRCAPIDTDATVDTQQATLTMASRFGSEGFDLEQLARGIWRAKPRQWWPPGGILIFDADLRAFRFFSARTRGLRFHRAL